ncbi:MAG TPA: hydroxymethylbilane synthase [Thermoleophilaceae bacterium]|jgi:hydroxymethylbilane synthase|nr:hydroxymethylbilane synthase [Thermoleophilaceae bacterium]
MVAEMLGGAELVEITTSGDRVRAAGDKSRFVKEIEEALLAGEVDLAVHSAKDVPGELPDGLEIAAVPPRADPRDVLVGAESLESLPAGARIGTASIRRRSQLLALRDDLEIVELRGNVDTRLRKLEEGGYDAIVLAAAGLDRLGVPHAEGARPLQAGDMTPAPGQGCLALQIRSDDSGTRAAVERISDPVAFACLAAERDCVIALDATCDTPIGVLAECEDPKRIRIRAYAGAPDGSVWIRDELEAGPDAGRLLAERMLSAGVAEILAT